MWHCMILSVYNQPVFLFGKYLAIDYCVPKKKSDVTLAKENKRKKIRTPRARGGFVWLMPA